MLPSMYDGFTARGRHALSAVARINVEDWVIPPHCANRVAEAPNSARFLS
jgi:hypothetical protein